MHVPDTVTPELRMTLHEGVKAVMHASLAIVNMDRPPVPVIQDIVPWGTYAECYFLPRNVPFILYQIKNQSYELNDFYEYSFFQWQIWIQ